MKISSKTLFTSAPVVLVGLVSLLFMIAPIAHAQEKTAPPPPKLEKIDEVTEADIKMAKPKTDTVKMKERRENDITKEVEVTSGNSTYVVKPNPAPTGTREGDAVRPAMWKVKEFGGKKEVKEEAKVTTDPEALPVLPPGQYSTSKNGVTKPEKPEQTSSASASASARAAAGASAASASASAPKTKPPVKE